ncbi:MAG: hypothetical protein HQK83_04450 [Fibrobacteria bacterium]|nr:hypothetical protein [Fibrobacteria bacterium]
MPKNKMNVKSNIKLIVSVLFMLFCTVSPTLRADVLDKFSFSVSTDANLAPPLIIGNEMTAWFQPYPSSLFEYGAWSSVYWSEIMSSAFDMDIKKGLDPELMGGLAISMNGISWRGGWKIGYGSFTKTRGSSYVGGGGSSGKMIGGELVDIHEHKDFVDMSGYFKIKALSSRIFLEKYLGTGRRFSWNISLGILAGSVKDFSITTRYTKERFNNGPWMLRSSEEPDTSESVNRMIIPQIHSGISMHFNILTPGNRLIGLPEFWPRCLFLESGIGVGINLGIAGTEHGVRWIPSEKFPLSLSLSIPTFPLYFNEAEKLPVMRLNSPLISVGYVSSKNNYHDFVFSSMSYEILDGSHGDRVYYKLPLWGGQYRWQKNLPSNFALRFGAGLYKHINETHRYDDNGKFSHKEYKLDIWIPAVEFQLVFRLFRNTRNY